MNLDEIIKTRNSCRTYLPTAISDDTIKQIVDAGRLAPSAKNAQPWKFVCIKTDFTDNEKSKKISSIMANFYLQNKNDENKMKGASSVYATSKIIENCPAIILVFADSDYINRDRTESISDILSIGASVEHMVLKATELGLGSLWIADTYYVHKEIAEYIEEELRNTGNQFILNNHRLICAVALGERGEPQYERSRKSLEEVLTIINN